MTVIQGIAFSGEGLAEIREFEIAQPGPNEVRLSVKASGICGSDLHQMRRPNGLRQPVSGQPQHEYGTGRLLVAGHEPAGVIESIGSEVKDFQVGDRVLAYHIMGCGNCSNCRLGYPVMCTSERRAAYGGERDGAHGALLLVDQRSLIRLPDEITFVDGAMIACGVATAYSALRKSGIRSGQSLLVTGLGPVGLAVTFVASQLLGVNVIGSDLNQQRLEEASRHGMMAAVTKSGDEAVEEIRELTAGLGVHAAIDCSGAPPARLLDIAATRTWGTVVFVGISDSELTFKADRELIGKQLTLRGSWVSSIAEMEELTNELAARGLHPESLVTGHFSIAEAIDAYAQFAGGASGKMVIIP